MVSESREMCTLCAHRGMGAHIDIGRVFSGFASTMCGCAPKISILRVTHMKRTGKKRIIYITIGGLGRTPAHPSQKPPYNGRIQPVRPPTPMCAQGRTSTSGVKL